MKVHLSEAEREVGEEKRPEEVEGERDEKEFPLVPFLRRLDQIPTPPAPYSVQPRAEEVLCVLYVTEQCGICSACYYVVRAVEILSTEHGI